MSSVNGNFGSGGERKEAARHDLRPAQIPSDSISRLLRQAIERPESRTPPMGELADILERAAEPGPLHGNGAPLDAESAAVEAVRAAPGEEVLRAIASLPGRDDHFLGESVSSAALIEVLQRACTALLRGRGLETIALSDVAVGTGGLLFACGRTLEASLDVPVTYAASDINPQTLQVSKGLGGLVGADAEYRSADALDVGSFPGWADLTISDPPLNLRHHAGSIDSGDPRWRFGLPSPREATLLFLQAMLATLKPESEGGGLAVAVVSSGSLFSRGASSLVRARIVEQDYLRAIVALPEALVHGTGIAVNLVVLDTSKPKGWRGKVQMVDLRSQAQGSRTSRRALTEDGLVELERALARPKSTRFARAIGNSELVQRQVMIGLSEPMSMHARTEIAVPENVDVDGFLASRYGGTAGVSHEVKDTYVTWLPSFFFGSRDVADLRPLRVRGWDYRPLLSSVADLLMVKSAQAATRFAGGSWPEGPQDLLVIPTSPNGDARVVVEERQLPDEPCIAAQLRTEVSSAFLCLWLNSDAGRAFRRTALPMHRHIQAIATSSDVVAFCDRLLVPCPPVATQMELVRSVGAIGAAVEELSQLRRDVWADPSSSRSADGEVHRFLKRTSSFDAWADSLPYPLASSLWTYLSLRNNPAEAYQQALHFFEAWSVFQAAHLIGAIRQDAHLWDEHLGRLSGALTKQGLSLNRSSLGAWRVTLEFLGGVVRDGLTDEDPEERLRFQDLLGGVVPELAQRNLNTDAIRVLDKANRLRNNWKGHGGTISIREAKERDEGLHRLLLELRSSVGNGWAGLDLVRVGPATFDGTDHHHSTELMTGSKVPFIAGRFSTSRSLMTDHLYLTSTNGGSVRLPGLIRMGPEPEPSQNTCYFYNKVESDEALRFVAYQSAPSSEETESDPELAQIVLEIDAGHSG